MNKNKLQRKLSLVLALSMLAPTVTTLPVFAEVPVNGVEANKEEGFSIEDKINKDLKGAIKSQIGIKPTDEITNKNILNLKELYVGNNDFENLNGLEYAKNLRSLKSEHGTIKDLSALSNLPYFEELYVGGGGIVNGKPIIAVEKEETLLKLKILKKLTLGGSQIQNLEQLKDLTKLEYLDLSYNHMKNVHGIENFKNLKELIIDGRGLKNLNELKTFPISKILEKLVILGDRDVNIEDYSALQELKNLKYFYISYLNSDILKNLNGKSTIEHLYFNQYVLDESNKEKDIQIFNETFKKFVNIKDLVIYDMPYMDFGIVKNFTKLKKLTVNSSDIEDLTPIKNLIELTQLDLSGNKIIDLTPITNLTNLQYLNISSNNIEDLTPLQSLYNLKSIDASYNKIKDITPIENLKNIVELNISDNPIEKITNQKSWPKLGKLDISESKIQDLRFISKYILGEWYDFEDSYGGKYSTERAININNNNLNYNMTKRNQEILKADLPVTYYLKDKNGGKQQVIGDKFGFLIKDGILQLNNDYAVGEEIELEYVLTTTTKYDEYKDYQTGKMIPAGEAPLDMKLGTITLNTSNLKPAQALTYTPETTLLQVEKDSKEVDYKKGITNLPDGAEVTPQEGQNPDLKTLGKQQVKVQITLEDGSYLETEIPIEVKITPTEIKPIPEITEGNIIPEIIKVGDQIDLTNNIKNLPEGTQVKDITEPKIDTTKAGTYTATVEITYKDGSGTTIEIPVEIKDLESNKYNPEITVPKIEVKTGEKVNLADLIEKTPEIKEIIEIKPIDTETEGLKEGLVKIIFNDGSEKEIPVKVEIKLKDKLPDNPVLPSNPETPTNPEITTPVIPFKPVEDTFHYGEIRIIDHTDTQKPKEKEDSKPEEKDNKSELDKIKADLDKESKQETNKNKTIFKIGQTNYKTLIAGKEEVKQLNIAPFIEKDRTYLPIRFVGEALGLEVSYDDKTRKATFKDNTNTLEINIDTKKATLNGKPYKMEVDPLIKNNRLVAPVSVIGKAFNKTVSNLTENKDTDIVWNNKTKEVIIYNFK